jgi:hypothetical protein
MAISKAELEQRVREQQRLKLNNLEDAIESVLVAGSRRWSISNVDSEFVPEIIRRYEHVGWKVERIHDSRDGDYLKFS